MSGGRRRRSRQHRAEANAPVCETRTHATYLSRPRLAGKRLNLLLFAQGHRETAEEEAEAEGEGRFVGGGRKEGGKERKAGKGESM